MAIWRSLLGISAYLLLTRRSFVAAIGDPALATIESKVIPAFRDGIKSYMDLLDHLEDPKISSFGKKDMEIWAGELRQLIYRMNTLLKETVVHAAETNNALNDESEILAADLSAKDREIQDQDKQIKVLVAKVKGSKKRTKLAEKGLKDASKRLKGYEDNVRQAKEKLDKAKNRCFGRRRKRFAQSQSVHLRPKRGNIWDKIKKPFKDAGDLVQKGICRAVNTINGNIKKLKKLRDQTRAAVRKAEINYSRRKRNLWNQMKNLEKIKKKVLAERAEAVELRKHRDVITGQILDVGHFGQEVKKSMEFLQRLLVRSAVLKDTVAVMLIDASALLGPLNEAGAILQNKLKFNQIPLIPSIDSEDVEKIRRNLERLDVLLPSYPLIIDEPI